MEATQKHNEVVDPNLRYSEFLVILRDSILIFEDYHSRELSEAEAYQRLNLNLLMLQDFENNFQGEIKMLQSVVSMIFEEFIYDYSDMYEYLYYMVFP